MADTNSVRRANLSHSEVVQIVRLIEAHADINEQQNLFAYHPNWSDERIASMLAAVPGREHLTPGIVCKFRKGEMKLRTKTEMPGNKGGFVNLYQRLDNIEQRQKDLDARLKAVEDAFK
jgi:hypothetical protein